MNLKAVLESFAEDSADVQWLRTEGKERFERKTPLTYAEWNELLEKSFKVMTAYSAAKKTVEFYLHVVMRGISDLHAAVTAGLRYVEMYDLFHNWWHALLYQLHAARFGLGSEYCTRDQSLLLINGLLAIAQFLKNDQLLEHVAEKRAPGDEDAQKQFFASWKNW